jgi:hypothetical protein
MNGLFFLFSSERPGMELFYSAFWFYFVGVYSSAARFISSDFSSFSSFLGDSSND